MKKRTVYAILSVILCVVLAVSIFNIIKIVSENPKLEDSNIVSRVIERDGVEYYPRQDITTFLLVGLDRTGVPKESESYINSARADVVMVITFDNTKKEINVLNLNRDSIIPVQILGVNGYPAGNINGQLALAHTYGKGLKDSAENTVTTVSNYLYNLDIDYYATVGMDCIETLTDALGGVTVTVTDDFSAIDASIPMGEVNLNGKQAVSFIRYRQSLGDGLNSSRMLRGEEYFKGLFTAVKEKHGEDSQSVINIYESMADKIITNCSVQAFSEILDKFSEFNLSEVVSPKGENKMGAEFMEFYIDSADIDRIILDFFYSEK